jgi:hypothetical protein
MLANVPQSVAPWINASVIMLPTAEQFNRMKQGQHQAVALDMTCELPARITAYIAGSALLGPVSGALAVAMAAKAIEEAMQYDNSVVEVKAAHAVVGGMAALTFAAQQIGLSPTLSIAAGALPYAGALIPSASQIETYRAGNRAHAIGQWTLASFGKVALVYGLTQAGSFFFSSPSVAIGALAAVTVAKPAVDRLASELVPYIAERGNRALLAADAATGEMSRLTKHQGQKVARGLAAVGPAPVFSTLVLGVNALKLPGVNVIAIGAPIVEAITPSDEQMGMFEAGQRVNAVAQWTISSIVSTAIAYGVIEVTGEYLGISGAGLAAVVVVDAMKPVVNRAVSGAASYVSRAAGSVWTQVRSFSWFNSKAEDPSL